MTCGSAPSPPINGIAAGARVGSRRWRPPGRAAPRVGSTPPNQHLNAASLRTTLRAVVDTRAARLGTLHELTKLAPVAILVETLGYHPTTIERHSIASGATYAQYIGALTIGADSAP